MSKKVGIALKYIISFIVVILVFNVLLFLVCSFDSKLIENNVKESSKILREQGLFYNISKVFNVTINNYTDSIIINETYSVDKNHPFKAYMTAKRNYKKGQTTGEIKDKNGEVFSINYSRKRKEEVYYYNTLYELVDFLDGKIHHSINYGRYWHGYLILYRPLLLVFNIGQIRLLSLIVFAGLLAYFIYLLSKRFSKYIVIIFGMSLVCSGYFSASQSLESTPIFLTMMISSIIFLKRIDKIKNVGLYIFIVGCIANFVDFLTVPLITLGTLCTLYLLKLIEEKKGAKECIKFLIKCSILWVIGYAGTWFAKWILYDLLINDGNSMVHIGLSQVLFRTRRVNEVVGNTTNLPSTLISIMGKSSLYVMITTLILLIMNKFKVFTTKIEMSAVSFAIIAVYPVIWYVVLANHTLFHSFFTYRQSLVYMLGLLLFLNQLFFGDSKKKMPKKTEK